MKNTDADYCMQAVAYLKAWLREDGSQADFVLTEEESPVSKDLGNGLFVSYLVDEGTAFSYVQHKHLRSAGITEQQLHTKAIENLRVLAESALEVRQYGSVYAATMGDNFEASLILVPEFWKEWYGHLVPHDFLAAIPARDILAFGDASSKDVVAELQAICHRAADADVDHPLSFSLFIRDSASWVPIHG